MSKGSSTTRSGSSSITRAMSVPNGGGGNVSAKVNQIRKEITNLKIPKVGETVKTTIDGVKVEIRHTKATPIVPAEISLKVGREEEKYFSYSHYFALAKYKEEKEAANNMYAELNKLLLRKYRT